MKIKDSIRIQFSLMINKPGFQLSFCIVLIYCFLTYLVNSINMIGTDISISYSADTLFALNSYSPYWNLFSKIFPYIVALPFAFSYIEDNNVNIHPYLQGRIGRKNYFIGKTIVGFIGGFIIILLPFLINLFLCYITFPNNLNTYFGDINTSGYCSDILGTNVFIDTGQKGLLFPQVYFFSPLLYNIIFMILCSIFAGIISMWLTSISYIFNNNKITIFIPTFLLFYISNALDGVIFIDKKYINLNWLDYVCVNTFYGKEISIFLIGLIIIIGITISITAFVINKEKSGVVHCSNGKNGLK